MHGNSLGGKLDDLQRPRTCCPCMPGEEQKPKPLTGEARNGHAEVPKQAEDWCAPYRRNDIENQTATNAFEHPTFEADKQARTERRMR